jgi:transposase
LPDLLAVHAQRTERLTDVLREIGFALGGEAGERITEILQMHWSADTLLRITRRTVLQTPPPPRVVGVDDWAIRKGRVYGTILVDLERHRPIELLPDRKAETLADWLKTHPGIEVVSRDRAGAYARGIQKGAPQAVQIADRWHLLKNLWDALVASYDCYHRLIKQIPIESENPTTASPSELIEPSPTSDSRRKARHQPTARELARQHRREYWLTKFQQVHELRARGMGIKTIARQLALSRNTVRKYSRLPELPHKMSPKSGPRLIDPYRSYLRERLISENLSSRKLWKEIQDRGFPGGHTIVYQCVAQLRQELEILPLRGPRRSTTPPPRARPLTSRMLATLVLRPPDTLSDTQQQLISSACQLHPDIQQATYLAVDFAARLRNRDASELDHWIQTVMDCDLLPLQGFVSGINRDYAAVRAALTLPWSNGQVEGQVNRLKVIKRQMYGRANFDLLRQRVLHPP